MTEDSTLNQTPSSTPSAEKPGEDAFERSMVGALSMIALSNEVLKDSRPLDAWEKKVLADFTWAEFCA